MPLVSVASLLLVVAVSIFSYRLTLHPLARYPGPLLARLTDWISVYQTLTGDRHLDLLKWHEKYGPIVRIGPNTLSFNIGEAVVPIYSDRHAPVRKAPWYKVIEASAEMTSIHAEIDPGIHARLRKLLEPAFTAKSLRTLSRFVTENVKIFRDLVSQSGRSNNGWSDPFNMSQWSAYLAYDIMGALVFAKQFKVMTTDCLRYVPELLKNSTAFVNTVAAMPFKTFNRSLLASGVLSSPYIGGEMAKDDVRFHEYAAKILKERMASDGESIELHEDIMHHLLHPRKGERLPLGQLQAESSLLIAAGADTTSLTLAAAFFYLLHNPPAMEALVREVRSVRSFKDTDEISPSELDSLTYLHAVVNETLRLAPPVPSLLPREVMKHGIRIGNDHIPEGTIVGISAYVIHRNPKYFPEPNVFRPERWIPTNSRGSSLSSLSNIPPTHDSGEPVHRAFLPFSKGPRACIGRQLAYLELCTTLAVLLQEFDIRLARDPLTQELLEDSTDWRKSLANQRGKAKNTGKGGEGQGKPPNFVYDDHFLAYGNGPMVQFRPHGKGK